MGVYRNVSRPPQRLFTCQIETVSNNSAFMRALMAFFCYKRALNIANVTVLSVKQ